MYTRMDFSEHGFGNEDADIRNKVDSSTTGPHLIELHSGAHQSLKSWLEQTFR